VPSKDKPTEKNAQSEQYEVEDEDSPLIEDNYLNFKNKIYPAE